MSLSVKTNIFMLLCSSTSVSFFFSWQSRACNSTKLSYRNYQWWPRLPGILLCPPPSPLSSVFGIEIIKICTQASNGSGYRKRRGEADNETGEIRQQERFVRTGILVPFVYFILVLPGCLRCWFSLYISVVDNNLSLNFVNRHIQTEIKEILQNIRQVSGIIRRCLCHSGHALLAVRFSNSSCSCE